MHHTQIIEREHWFSYFSVVGKWTQEGAWIEVFENCEEPGTSNGDHYRTWNLLYQCGKLDSLTTL